jgi:hypothetical protein
MDGVDVRNTNLSGAKLPWAEIALHDAKTTIPRGSPEQASYA